MVKETVLDKLYKSLGNLNCKILESDGDEVNAITRSIEEVTCLIMALEGVNLSAVWNDGSK